MHNAALHFLVLKVLGALTRLRELARWMIFGVAHAVLFWAIPVPVPQAVRDVERAADADVGEEEGGSGESEEVEGGSAGGEEGKEMEEDQEPITPVPSAPPSGGPAGLREMWVLAKFYA